MSDRYPAHIPPALAKVLGMPPQELHPWWAALREVGVDVPRRYEGEVAAALHFLMRFAIERPDDWWGAAVAELHRLRDGGTLAPTEYGVVAQPVEGYDRDLDLPETAYAAGLALRSYQYGNSSPELAQGVADTAMRTYALAKSPGGHSAHAQRVGDKVHVHLLGTTDEGPAKIFKPLLTVELDEPHALELLGMLMIAHREVAQIDAGDER